MFPSHCITHISLKVVALCRQTVSVAERVWHHCWGAGQTRARRWEGLHNKPLLIPSRNKRWNPKLIPMWEAWPCMWATGSFPTLTSCNSLQIGPIQVQFHSLAFVQYLQDWFVLLPIPVRCYCHWIPCSISQLLFSSGQGAPWFILSGSNLWTAPGSRWSYLSTCPCVF